MFWNGIVNRMRLMAILFAALVGFISTPASASFVPLADTYLAQFLSPDTGFRQYACVGMTDVECAFNVGLLGYQGDESEWLLQPQARVMGIDISLRQDLIAA